MPEFHYISINLSVFEEAILFTSPFLISFLTLKKKSFWRFKLIMPHIMPDLDFSRRYLAPDLPQWDFLEGGLALLGRRGPVVG